MSSDTNVWCLFIKSGGKSFFKGIINYYEFLCNYSNHLQHRSAHNLLSLQFLWFIQHGDIKGRPRAILLCRHIDAKVDIAEKIFSRRARRCAHFVRTTCHCEEMARCLPDALSDAYWPMMLIDRLLRYAGARSVTKARIIRREGELQEWPPDS